MSVPFLPEAAASTAVPRGTEVLVVGLADAASGPLLVGVPDELASAWSRRHGSDLLTAARSIGAAPRPGTTVVLHADPVLVVTGLGHVDVTPERARQAAGHGVRAAAALAGDDRTLTVAVSLDAVDRALVTAVAEGGLLAAYRYAKASTKPTPRPVRSLTIVSAGREARAAVDEAGVLARAVCQAREWVNAPANTLYPETFAEEARASARDTRLEVEVLDERALAKAGYGGILAVGEGSERPPRMVRLSWAPRGARAHLALVGKGITFDTGGLNLKTAEGMYDMKCDMAGAAAVLAATRAIAELKLRVRVTAWAPLAENMPSGSAQRPSDVLHMFGGTTVENANSDAEGRLVMADALARACQDSPDLVVDVATLTGACVVALGEQTGGLMASDDATADDLLDAAEVAGEAFWHLPIPEEARENLRSEVADLRSSGKTRWGGALTAAAFLREFVGDGVRWAHLDIAGPAWNKAAPRHYVPTGGTGSAVRTLVALARQLANGGRP